MPNMAYNPSPLKPVHFWGTSREDLRKLGEDARETLGFQLYKIQQGLLPDDWKPMPGLGNTYRLIYVARFAEAIYVLHAFQKKTRKTSRRDVATARARYRQLVQWRKGSIT
jgi:phage-related protein